MHIILCFPFLDLRFLTDPGLAPKPPGWPQGTYQTVGSLGRVISPATAGREGEVRANAAILFQSEYSRPQKGRRRRWQDNPSIADIATVSGRRLLASSDGHLRLEITLSLAEAWPDTLPQLLDSVLTIPVTVVRSGETELISTGFRFARVYLTESAKTAEKSDLALLEVLLREGSGSPFIVGLWPDPPPRDCVDFWVPTPKGPPLDVGCSQMELAGQSLSVWQIWNAPAMAEAITWARGLCRTICNLSEVTLLIGLLDPDAMKPYSLSIPAVESFLRQRVGQLRRKQHDCWPVLEIQRLAARHLRVSIGNGSELRSSLSRVRRDIAGDVIATLTKIDEAAQLNPTSSTVRPPMTLIRNEMKYEDKELLVSILAEQAENSGDSKAYFSRLLRAANLPREFKSQRLNQMDGRADAVARALVDWALDQGLNPSDRRYSTLGSLVGPQLREFGVEKAVVLASAIYAYRMYVDPALLNDLRVRFQLPERVSATGVARPDSGPDFAWRGPDDDTTLQAWLRPEPVLLDMGLLIKAIERSRSVCQISVGATGKMGTGVLVGDDLVLTNYHVLATDGKDDVASNAATVVVTFGNYTGSEKTGKTQLRLVETGPIVESSHTSELDFVLLRVQGEIRVAPGVQPATIKAEQPKIKASMNILQHPLGAEMKLAISDDAVTFVDMATGIVQYVTRAFLGSSGSPCFNEDWELVALHHAERSRSFGRVREGILMSSIHPKIAQHLMPTA